MARALKKTKLPNFLFRRLRYSCNLLSTNLKQAIRNGKFFFGTKSSISFNAEAQTHPPLKPVWQSC